MGGGAGVTDELVYVEKAVDTAVADVEQGMADRGGAVTGVERWRDDQGHWLRITVSLAARSGSAIRSARVVLGPDGPDMDAETVGIVYGTAFLERIDTKLPAAVDSVTIDL